MHIKACLARGHIHRVRRQFQMMFKPAPGKVNYTQAKAYCPISPLSFMQKTMQKLVTRNIQKDTLRHVPYIYNNLTTYQASPQEPQCTMITHIQKAVENKKLHLRFP